MASVERALKAWGRPTLLMRVQLRLQGMDLGLWFIPGGAYLALEIAVEARVENGHPPLAGVNQLTATL